ncbi:MAG TPA: hypothetical protein VG842_04150 [Sediminibacterium sp.]|nr:hypothetical protein [Sediminibacterium sp.]
MNILIGGCLLLASCSVLNAFHRKPREGCPVTNNIGAEKIMSGDPAIMKKAAKARKHYKMDKGLSQY